GYNDQIEEYLTQILKHFKLMEDRDFLCFIEIMISLSTIAKNLFYNLVNRTFNKQISYINRIEKEKIDPRILTKLEIKENSPLKLHIPTKSFAKISKKSNLSDIFMRYWNDPVDKEIKSNVEKFLAELKPENNVILINTFDFAFNEEIKRENIYEKVRDIYICEDFSNPKIERVYESSKNNFIGFLYDLEEKNSNVIFAFDNNRRKTIFDNYVKDEKFLYNFIYLVLAYNGRI
ncbi:MAG: hypothetical protein JW891_17680, partial [Candidatus Lokiarchaeota archaeon]|nr:hypothetical protein [Candidatus Lokiarchaeota archaeon]